MEGVKSWQSAGLDTGSRFTGNRVSGLDPARMYAGLLRWYPYAVTVRQIPASEAPIRVSFHAATAALIIALFAAPCLAQSSPEDVVTAQRAHYGERVAPSEAPTLLQAIAADLTQTFGTRYGRLVKTTGNQCGGFACDIVCDQNGDLFDVFTDGPDATQHYAGQAVPQWIPKGTLDGRTCALVEAPSSGTQAPSSVDLTPLLERLDRLEAALLDLNARERADAATLAQRVDDRAATLNAAIATLDARPIVTACKASVFGVPIHCEVKP